MSAGFCFGENRLEKVMPGDVVIFAYYGVPVPGMPYVLGPTAVDTLADDSTLCIVLQLPSVGTGWEWTTLWKQHGTSRLATER